MKRRIGTLLILLLLVVPDLVVGQAARHSARLGRLQITATAVGPYTPDPKRAVRKEARPGHHFVAVFLKLKNVGMRRADIWLEPVLKVDAGYEYDEAGAVGLGSPRAAELLPTEESEGGYAFEVKDGTTPITLTITAKPATLDEAVATIMKAPRVTLSLRGLPAPELPPKKPKGKPS